MANLDLEKQDEPEAQEASNFGCFHGCVQRLRQRNDGRGALLAPDKAEDDAIDDTLRHHEALGVLREFLVGVITAEISPRQRTPRSHTHLVEGQLAADDSPLAVEGSREQQIEENFERFESAWCEEQPFGDVTWHEIRGPLGESALNWMWHIKARDAHQVCMSRHLKDIMLGMLKAHPEIAKVHYTKEPYVGQSILHQACADGDEELVLLLLEHPEHVDLNSRITGEFIIDTMKAPADVTELHDMVTPKRTGLPGCVPQRCVGQTPLEVALLAPKDDGDGLNILHHLLDAGAQTIMYDTPANPTKVLYTLLHVLARSRWQGDGPYHVSKPRTALILELLMDQSSEWYQAKIHSMKNAAGITPLQAAAALGNEFMYIEMLEFMKVYVSEWGNMKEFGFPLKELDSGASESMTCGLELMTLHKRGHLLHLGLNKMIIQEKWNLFGRTWMLSLLLVQTSAVFFTAVVCLDDTVGYHQSRWWARNAVYAIAFGHTVFKVILFLTCARDEAWFKSMAILPGWFKSNGKIDIMSLLEVRTTLEMFTMCLLVLTVPWYRQDWVASYPHYNLVWHTLASLWWFVFCAHVLRFFELFEATAPLASALPEIIQRDMIPFLFFYAVILLCSSVALRIATTTTAGAGDMIVGTWYRTALTLEESIHGPDVQWRNIVENHPGIASLVFIVFLWITLMMMTILVAMFSNRFDELKERVHERFLYRRAMFCITTEKLMPVWFHELMHFQLGKRLGGLWNHHGNGRKGTAVQSADAKKNWKALKTKNMIAGLGALKRKSKAGTADRISSTHIDEQGMERPSRESLLEDKSLLGDERWLIWKGSQRDFHKWREPSKAGQALYL